MINETCWIHYLATVFQRQCIQLSSIIIHDFLNIIVQRKTTDH